MATRSRAICAPDIPTDSMIYEQFIADMVEVTQYLRKRFGQDRIYLMAHFGGTVFALQAAARHPELYHAYIGMAQMVNQLESEQMAYAYAPDQSQANGDSARYEQLAAVPPPVTVPLPPAYDALRDTYMHHLGIGTTRDMESVVTRLEIPVYFFSGAYDYTCNCGLSRQYLDQLEAPLKGFYLFEHSAHTPLFEEPDRVLTILQTDVLNATNTLAD